MQTIKRSRFRGSYRSLNALWGAALAGVMFVSPALAGVICGRLDAMLEHGRDKLHQVPVAKGLTNGGTGVLVLVDQGGRWSLLETKPDGSACVMGVGEAWQPVDPGSERPPDGDPA